MPIIPDGEVPLSIHYLMAYMKDKRADCAVRAELVKGLDGVAQYIDKVDPRK